jgi:hypothetical protein
VSDEEENRKVSFSTLPDEKDWISAYWLTVRHRWLWQRISITFLLIWAAYFALVAGVDILDFGWHPELATSWLWASALYSITVAPVLVLITMALTPRRVRKAVKDTRRLAPELNFEADNSGIQCRNAISTSALAWPQFERWLENRRVIVLMITRSNFFIIRKCDLGPGIETSLRSHLIAANVPNR